MRPLRCALILLCVFTASTIFPPAATATLDSRATAGWFVPGIRVGFHHYNLCSARPGCPNDQGLNAQAIATWNWGAAGGWSLSINEACLADMVYISNGVGQPYDPYIADTTVPACATTVPGWFGNAIIAAGARRGPAVPYQFAKQETGTNNCTPGVHECRGMICIPVDTYVGPYATCSAHFENNNVSVAQAQEAEYLYVLATSPATKNIDRIASGDFNLTPSQLHYFPNAYRSVNNQNSIPASSPTTKFDYIWVNNGAITNFLSSRWCDAAASDHCWMGTKVWN